MLMFVLFYLCCFIHSMSFMLFIYLFAWYFTGSVFNYYYFPSKFVISILSLLFLDFSFRNLFICFFGRSNSTVFGARFVFLVSVFVNVFSTCHFYLGLLVIYILFFCLCFFLNY